MALRHGLSAALPLSTLCLYPLLSKGAIDTDFGFNGWSGIFELQGILVSDDSELIDQLVPN